MLLLQALHSPHRIYLNAIIALYIFSDGLIYVNILEHFNLTSMCLHLILSDVPYFGANEAKVDLY